MNPDLHIASAIAREYASAASLLSHAKRIRHDREKELRMVRAHHRRLRTAREDVKDLGKEAARMWAHVDRNAKLGHYKETAELAEEIVQGVRAHVA